MESYGSIKNFQPGAFGGVSIGWFFMFSSMESLKSVLSNAFSINPSVNFVVKQDHKRIERIEHLVNYALWVGNKTSGVFFSENKSTKS